MTAENDTAHENSSKHEVEKLPAKKKGVLFSTIVSLLLVGVAFLVPACRTLMLYNRLTGRWAAEAKCENVFGRHVDMYCSLDFKRDNTLYVTVHENRSRGHAILERSCSRPHGYTEFLMHWLSTPYVYFYHGDPNGDVEGKYRLNADGELEVKVLINDKRGVNEVNLRFEGTLTKEQP